MVLQDTLPRFSIVKKCKNHAHIFMKLTSEDIRRKNSKKQKRIIVEEKSAISNNIFWRCSRMQNIP